MNPHTREWLVRANVDVSSSECTKSTHMSVQAGFEPRTHKVKGAEGVPPTGDSLSARIVTRKENDGWSSGVARTDN